MRDPAVPARDHLITRPHDVLAGAHLDLAGPGDPGEQLRDIDGAARKRADRLGDRGEFLLAHRVEPDRARWDRRGMAVLYPQEDALPRGGRRHAGIAVRRPGIGIVRTGERAVRGGPALAKGVEGVFYDIVPRRARNMDKELSSEITELESRAHLSAVDRQRGHRVSGALAPFRDDRVDD